jgi:chloramphenicol 3-O-phosphotransferase
MLGKLGGIKRRLTKRIVDAAFLIKSPANLAKAVVILHGASSTGKSYALRWLNRRYKGCVFIEMDRFLRSRVLPDPGILKTALDLLTDAGVAVKQAHALAQKIENADLLEGKYPRHRSMVELLKACLAHDTVIATCGDLPPPRLDNGYYEMLGRYTLKTPLHVLVAPESKVLAERLRMRRRESDMDRWLASNRRRLSNKAYYDLVLSGTEPTANILELIRNSISNKRDRQGVPQGPW